MATIDAFEFLGVTKDANFEDIASRYRELAKVYHPEVEGGNADLFSIIKKAFITCADEIKRRDEAKTISPEDFNHKFKTGVTSNDMVLSTRTDNNDVRESRTYQDFLNEQANVDREIDRIKPLFKQGEFDNSTFQRYFQLQHKTPEHDVSQPPASVGLPSTGSVGTQINDLKPSTTTRTNAFSVFSKATPHDDEILQSIKGLPDITRTTPLSRRELADKTKSLTTNHWAGHVKPAEMPKELQSVNPNVGFDHSFTNARAHQVQLERGMTAPIQLPPELVAQETSVRGRNDLGSALQKFMAERSQTTVNFQPQAGHPGHPGHTGHTGYPGNLGQPGQTLHQPPGYFQPQQFPQPQMGTGMGSQEYSQMKAELEELKLKLTLKEDALRKLRNTRTK